MKRIHVAGMLAIGMVAGLVCSAGAAGLAKSGSFEKITTIKNVGASAVETTKAYWEGNRMRIEQYTVGGRMVRIVSGNVLYMYSPARKQALKVVIPAKSAQSVPQMLMAQASSVKGGKKVGAGKVSGIACDVYMVSGPKGSGGRAKVYMSKDSRLPLPLRAEISQNGMTEVTETRNIRLNTNISDSMFSIPKGVKIVEQKMPTAPSKAPSKGKK